MCGHGNKEGSHAIVAMFLFQTFSLIGGGSVPMADGFGWLVGVESLVVGDCLCSRCIIFFVVRELA